MKTLKKYWWMLVPLGGLAFWLFSIKDKIFESVEQRVEVVNFVETSPTPEQRHRDRILDSVNNAHAIKIRQQRYDDNKKMDSLRMVKDSLFLDIVYRNADQLYQLKQSIDSIKDHH